MTRRILFIINPAAGGGRGRQNWEEFERGVLRATGGVPELGTTGDCASKAPALLKKVFTTAPGEAKRIAARASGNYDVLAAVGGDGTVWEVANGILTAKEKRAGLAILPCGTGNDIARNAGVRNLDDAWSTLRRGSSTPIDVIEVQCCADSKAEVFHALSFAGVGIIGPLLRAATPTAKRLLGQRLAYRLGLLRTLCSYKPAPMRIKCDGQAFEGRFLFLGASNGEHAGGGLRLAPGAQINDGLLNINLVMAVGRVDGLGQLGRLARGQHTNHPKVRYFQSRRISVDAELPLEVAVDGELVGHTPARFEVKPRVLSLFANAECIRAVPP